MTYMHQLIDILKAITLSSALCLLTLNPLSAQNKTLDPTATINLTQQHKKDKGTKIKKDSLNIKHTLLPILFYLPETSLGLGATGISTYKRSSHAQSTRPSQILYSAVYTLKKQLLLFVPFTLWGNDNNTRIKGELGYYKYFYNYYGIGGDTGTGSLENYDVTFPRLQLSYAKKMMSNLYLGVGFHYDHFNITQIDPSGLLATVNPIGWQGGQKANIEGLIIQDTRDNIFAATKGYYLELSILRSLPSFISDFSYSKISLNYNNYFKITKDAVLASQLSYTHASASTPFFDLPYLSTPSRSRGHNDRRYINSTLIAFDTELRFPIFKKLRGATFIGLAQLPKTTWSWLDASPKISYGFGFRYEINSEDRIRLRLDIGRGENTTNIYFTVNEAF